MASRRATYRLPLAAQEVLAAELWALGTEGLHVREAAGGEVVDAYFAPSVTDAELRRAAAACGAELVEVAAVADEDWLAAYRARSRPFVVGPFVLDPREPEAGATDAPHEGFTVRVPARNAFGTGSHESTRLVLQELPALDLAGASVLDVGTGSGILAFAALRLGARRVVGFDLDAPSVFTARDNARLNGLAPGLFAGRAEALVGGFERVLVNILPERWLPAAGAVVDRLAAPGVLLVSGLLWEQRDEVLDALAPHGLAPCGERRDGDWLALRLERR